MSVFTPNYEGVVFEREGGELFFQGGFFFHKDRPVPKGGDPEKDSWEEWWWCPMCKGENYHRVHGELHWTPDLTCKVCDAHLARADGRRWKVANAVKSKLELLGV